MPFADSSELAQVLGWPSARRVEAEIPAGVAGTERTIAQMQRLVSDAKRNWGFLCFVSSLLSDLPPKDHLAEAQRLFDFVKQNVRFVKDPAGVEVLEHPFLTLQRGASDCDGLCTLLASLNEAAGLRTHFVTIKANPTAPGEFSHVYCVVDVPDVGSFAEDPAIPSSYFGWEAPLHNGKRSWPASADLSI